MLSRKNLRLNSKRAEKNRSRNRRRTRPLFFESLEERRVLAVSVFEANFLPDTIGPDSTSTLQFTITNDATPDNDLSFTATLTDLAVAAAPNVTSTDDPVANTADPGGTSFNFGNFGLGANETLVLTVDITGSMSGSVSSDLFAGETEIESDVTANLTVDTDRPGFTMAFTDASVSLGQRTTLIYTIDNDANLGTASNLTFTHNLPVGLEVAGPANGGQTTIASGLLTAEPGASIISFGPAFFGGASIAAGASGTISVDVIATGVGTIGTTTEELTSTDVSTTESSGKASATLLVTTPADIHSIMSFTDDPVPAGGSVTAEIEFTNRDRFFNTATDIDFLGSPPEMIYPDCGWIARLHLPRLTERWRRSAMGRNAFLVNFTPDS